MGSKKILFNYSFFLYAYVMKTIILHGVCLTITIFRCYYGLNYKYVTFLIENLSIHSRKMGESIKMNVTLEVLLVQVRAVEESASIALKCCKHLPHQSADKVQIRSCQ